MPRNILLPAAIVAACLAFAAYSTFRAPAAGGDSVAPLAADAPNMLPVFQAGTAQDKRYDAVAAATICEELRDVLVLDGQLPTPALKSETQLEDVRVLCATYKRGGLSFVNDYPRFVDVVNDFLLRRIGERPVQPLSPELRTKWIQAYDDLGKACRAAAAQL